MARRAKYTRTHARTRAQTDTHARADGRTQTCARTDADTQLDGIGAPTFATEDAHENAVLGRRLVAPHGEAAAARGGPMRHADAAAAVAALRHSRSQALEARQVGPAQLSNAADPRGGRGGGGRLGARART